MDLGSKNTLFLLRKEIFAGNPQFLREGLFLFDPMPQSKKVCIKITLEGLSEGFLNRRNGISLRIERAAHIKVVIWPETKKDVQKGYLAAIMRYCKC